MKTVNYKLLEIKFKTFGTRKYARFNEKFHRVIIKYTK